MDFKLLANIFALWFGLMFLLSVFGFTFWVFDFEYGYNIIKDLGLCLVSKLTLKIFIISFLIDLVGQPIYRREYEIKEWFRKQFIK